MKILTHEIEKYPISEYNPSLSHVHKVIFLPFSMDAHFNEFFKMSISIPLSSLYNSFTKTVNTLYSSVPSTRLVYFDYFYLNCLVYLALLVKIRLF